MYIQRAVFIINSQVPSHAQDPGQSSVDVESTNATVNNNRLGAKSNNYNNNNDTVVTIIPRRGSRRKSRTKVLVLQMRGIK